MRISAFFLFIIYLASCSPENVNPIGLNYIPDFKKGDTLIYQSSSFEINKYVCFEALSNKRTYDWKEGKKTFEEGNYSFYSLPRDDFRSIKIGIQYNGISVITHAFTSLLDFNFFHKDSLLQKKFGSLNCTQVTKLVARKNSVPFSYNYYDLKYGVVAFTDSNHVEWELQNIVRP